MRTWYHKDGRPYEAVHLTWQEVEDILGRPHEGTAEDDKRLIAALREAGAPAWVEEGLGWIDETGWGVYRPSSSELVSVGDIARRAGVTVEAVHKWRQRHKDFPAPAAATSGGRVWVWAQVEEWLRRTGRWKEI